LKMLCSRQLLPPCSVQSHRPRQKPPPWPFPKARGETTRHESFDVQEVSRTNGGLCVHAFSMATESVILVPSTDQRLVAKFGPAVALVDSFSSETFCATSWTLSIASLATDCALSTSESRASP